jgi:deazaflavin-dependent oxidoreductase (nitroreductase family)
MSRALERYIFNPVVGAALLAGIAPRAFALLETTGRRTGRRIRTPVGNGLRGDAFWLVVANRRSPYVKNLLANPAVRIKVGRRWRCGVAHMLDDDDPLARRGQLDRENGFVGRLDGIIFRMLASAAATVRIDPQR